MRISSRLSAKIILAMGVLATGLTASAASLNQTTDGFTYFNKPGADLKALNADIELCRNLAEPTVQPGEAAGEAATDPYISSGFWERMRNADAAQNRLGRTVNVENCMVARGWRVVAVDPALGADLAGRPWAARLAVIGPWVGAAAPPGVVSRAFVNDALDTRTEMFAPAHPRRQWLDVQPQPPPAPDFVRLDPDDPYANSTEPVAVHRVKPLRADRVRPPSGDSGLIVVSLAGDGGFRLVLERVDVHGQPVSDGEDAEITLAQSQPDAVGPVRIYAVPAGHWRIAGMAYGPYLVNFCLGAPDFYLAPGAVLYAGAFDPAAPTLALNMDMAASRAAFPAGSRLAEALRPADWRNGSVGRCRGAYIYALEFPGRPFAEAYHMGSIAQMAAP
jgi:hypothetical protein